MNSLENILRLELQKKKVQAEVFLAQEMELLDLLQQNISTLPC
jgi:hypothetical protein